MSVYYLAVDIGAFTGRHVLFHLEEGKMAEEEVYRFKNEMIQKDGMLCWDIGRLFKEILTGMKKCREIGKIPYSMGIDAWGQDFVLLDENDRPIGDPAAFLDHRTDGMEEEVCRLISREQLYAQSGIHSESFNTIFQLMALKRQHADELEQARCLLYIPDYFHFLLTGSKSCEFTNATTGQLISPDTKNWNYDLIDLLGYPREIFPRVITPGTRIGTLRENIRREVGYDLQVVATVTHDSAAAGLAVPANDDDFIYISSGTWSFMGIERREADRSRKSYELHFTNEGGYAGHYRYLKDIEGMLMIGTVCQEFEGEYDMHRVNELARAAGDFPSRVDVKDPCFFAPENMTKAVQAYCRRTDQPVPETLSEVEAVVYASIAQSYAQTAKELEEMGQREYHRIHIIGEGCNDAYLNELTVKATGRRVHAGPAAASAIGNAAAQMLRAGEFISLEDARNCIHDSFDIQIYSPKEE